MDIMFSSLVQPKIVSVRFRRAVVTENISSCYGKYNMIKVTIVTDRIVTVIRCSSVERKKLRILVRKTYYDSAR